MASLLNLSKGVPSAKHKQRSEGTKKFLSQPPSGKMNTVSYPTGGKPKLSAPTPMGSKPKRC